MRQVLLMLFSRHHGLAFLRLVHFICYHLTNGGAAPPAIEFTAVVSLNALGRTRTVRDGIFDCSGVEATTDTDNHFSKMYQLRMIVN